MKVLLVGSGAREHIIAEHIAGSAELYAVMDKKNPGIARLAKKFCIADMTNPKAVAGWAMKEGMDLAFASPDAVLAAGVSDALIKAGIPTASPTKAAARIEWDKSYARSLMKKYRIKGSPEFEILRTEADALRKIKDLGEVAIKPLGLTGGKGVKVSGDHFKTHVQAMAYVKEVLKKDKRVLIEEKIDGEEFSLQIFSDGRRISPMPPVQDHKRAYEHDLGANTGGMGSYSTGKLLPFMRESDLEEGRKISQGVINALREEGAQFKGILYAQLMCTRGGVKLIEFNARFGDPEAMNVLSLLKTQLVHVLHSLAVERLVPTSFSEKSTVVKYLVPKGYPEKSQSDAEIQVDEKKMLGSGAKYYYASVYEKAGKIYTTHSRAIAVVGSSDSLHEAEGKAEEAAQSVHGPVWHRKDIGTRKLVQKRVEHITRLRS